MVEHREYNVGPFSDIVDERGDRLWSFLNEAQQVRRMIEKSDEGRPAAEGIAVPLCERFGEPVKQNRVRQLTGFLIKQVMQRYGYRHQREDVALGRNLVFSKASRYVRRDD